MKAKIKLLLHRLIGFERFLYWFSLFKIFTLKSDRKEKDLFLFLSKIKAKHDGVLLDIGANIGVTSTIMAKNTVVPIHAFEPLPLNIRILKKVLKRMKLEDRIILHETALGNYHGTCEMVLPIVENVSMHGLSHVVDPSITEFNTGEKTAQIPIDKLDNIFPSQKIAGIKLDVENFEHEVLKGAEQLLRAQHPIIYTELWDNENRQLCFSFLRGLGYTSFYNEKGKLKAFEANECVGQTFLFVQ
ncbi:MAG: FkbM family methyltransferase [Flavobacteriaceae bacterium]|nr:FkbM family methyltransferase [Flavobacteriaceae bacterium]